MTDARRHQPSLQSLIITRHLHFANRLSVLLVHDCARCSLSKGVCLSVRLSARHDPLLPEPKKILSHVDIAPAF